MTTTNPNLSVVDGGQVEGKKAPRRSRASATESPVGAPAAAPAAPTTPPAAPALPPLLLTKAVSKSRTSGVPKAEVTDMRKQADRLIHLVSEIESMDAERATIEAAMIPHALEAREAFEQSTGNTVKTVLVHSSTEQPVQINWKNAFSNISVHQEAPLRAHLGSAFDALLVVTNSCKIRKNADIVALKAALGDKFGAFFDEELVIAVQNEGMEKRAALRKTLSDVQNAALDLVFATAQHKASVSVK